MAYIHLNIEQDSIGNLNNVIRVSTHENLVESKKLYNTPLKWAAPKYTVDSKRSSGKVFNELGIVDADYRSSAPIEVSSYSAENVGNPKDKGDKVRLLYHIMACRLLTKSDRTHRTHWAG